MSPPPTSATRDRLDILARVSLGAIAVIAGARIAATHAPIAASTTPVPPASSASASTQGSLANGSADGEDVYLRLTERVGEAALETPNLAKGLKDLEVHWRRMQAPWKDTTSQPRARLVQLVALRTSATEVAHVVKKKSGETAVFDTRKWNTAEGSFAQREAIVTPTPATLRFRVRVPLHATLELAPAVLSVGDAIHNGLAGDVTFVARALPKGGGAPVELGRVVIGANERDRWTEHRFDLSLLAGKEIDLELFADAAPRMPGIPGPPPTVIALWGTPRIVRRAPARVPYNVLWIVVDSLRPDVIASFHDPNVDAAKKAGKHAAGDTWLPVIPGLTPHLDALAKRSVIYRDAISVAPWTRPGTLAMLSGLHSRQVGLSPLPWLLVDAQVEAYYASTPPLLSLSLRRAGVATRAFVNNNFMLGYAAVGVDMGFEHVEDYRYRTMDTAEVTKAALAGLRAHAGERFFQFVNYNSPHEPFDPPPECLARVPGAIPKKQPKKTLPGVGGVGTEPEGSQAPAMDPVKAYMAEACKDDAAIGELLAELDRLNLRERTLVVVTADHGETLSAEHEGIAEDLDQVNTRFHHAFGMWEETTRIPIVLSLPGVLPEGKAVDGRVTNLDLAPTILTLEGLERDPRQKGIDLVALATAGAKAPERPIVTLGRASAAVFWGRYRYVSREREAQKWTVGHGESKETVTIREELFDLVDDPGETKNLAHVAAFAPLVEEMKARLRAALDGADTADQQAEPSGAPPKIQIRFAGGGALRRVHATFTATGATSLSVSGVGIPAEAIRVTHVGDLHTFELATTTAADALVGVDFTVVPPSVPVRWTFSFDDTPLGDEAVFGGVLGVTTPGLAKGLFEPASRIAVGARALPFIDPTIDRGVFVVRLGAREGLPPERTTSNAGAAAAEVQSALKQWGYAK